MSAMNDERCDLELPNGKRCKNAATRWIHAFIDFTNDGPEDWPLATCDVHAEALMGKKAEIVRAGPDRRKQYAEMKAEQSQKGPR